MELQPHQPRQHSILPVLYVGPDLPPALVRELWSSGIGLLRFRTATSALRLLRHGRVEAIMLGGPDVEAVERFREASVPVIVIAAGDEWTTEGVVIIDGRADPATVVALIKHALLESAVWVAV